MEFFDNIDYDKIMSRSSSNDPEAINKFISEAKEGVGSLIQTIAILCQKLDIQIPEAKSLILRSPSWSGHQENFKSFNNNLQDF